MRRWAKSRGDIGFMRPSTRRDKIHHSRRYNENDYNDAFRKFVGCRVLVCGCAAWVGTCEDIFRDPKDQKKFKARIRLASGSAVFCAVKEMEILPSE